MVISCGSRVAPKELVKEYEYYRKAAIAFDSNKKLKCFLYTQLAKFYERKHDKKFRKN